MCKNPCHFQNNICDGFDRVFVTVLTIKTPSKCYYWAICALLSLSIFNHMGLIGGVESPPLQTIKWLMLQRSTPIFFSVGLFQDNTNLLVILSYIWCWGVLFLFSGTALKQRKLRHMTPPDGVDLFKIFNMWVNFSPTIPCAAVVAIFHDFYWTLSLPVVKCGFYCGEVVKWCQCWRIKTNILGGSFNATMNGHKGSKTPKSI